MDAGGALTGALLSGDGMFALGVIGDSEHQDTIEWLVGGRGEESVAYSCAARLVVCRDGDDEGGGTSDEPGDVTVCVIVQGSEVGYLRPEDAARLVSLLGERGLDEAWCEALIAGGWYRSSDDKGEFRVQLDARLEPEALLCAPPEIATPPVVGGDVAASKARLSPVLAAALVVLLAGAAGLAVLLYEPATDYARALVATAAGQMSSPQDAPDPRKAGVGTQARKTAQKGERKPERTAVPDDDGPSVARATAEVIPVAAVSQSGVEEVVMIGPPTGRDRRPPIETVTERVANPVALASPVAPRESEQTRPAVVPVAPIVAIQPADAATSPIKAAPALAAMANPARAAPSRAAIAATAASAAVKEVVATPRRIARPPTATARKSLLRRGKARTRFVRDRRHRKALLRRTRPATEMTTAPSPQQNPPLTPAARLIADGLRQLTLRPPAVLDPP